MEEKHVWAVINQLLYQKPHRTLQLSFVHAFVRFVHDNGYAFVHANDSDMFLPEEGYPDGPATLLNCEKLYNIAPMTDMFLALKKAIN